MKNFKYMPIVPIEHLELLEEQDGYLILVQLLKNPVYRDFYLNRDKNMFTILDNGQYEGYNCTDEELWEACKLIKPDVVCAPDAFMDKEETIKRTVNFFTYTMSNNKEEDLKNIQFMVIPHGNTPEEFLDCLNKMRVDSLRNKCFYKWIGLSKLGVLNAFKSRKKCIEYLKKNGYPLEKYNYHFLGCNEPREIVDAYESGAKSMDSCLPVLYASEHKIMPLDVNLKDRIKTPKDYFDRKLSGPELNIAWYNIIELKNLLKGKDIF